MRTLFHAPRSVPCGSLAAATLLIALTPLILTSHLPLSDLPNHLARQYVLRDLPDSPALQQFYTVRWALVPNLALELFCTPLIRLISPDLAVRLFCVATVALLVLGTRFLSRALNGETGALPLASAFLVWGGPFQFGFLSFCFGVGACLCLTGCHLRMSARCAAPRLRLAFLAGAGFLLMLCHVVAFALFALALCGNALATSRRPGTILVSQAWLAAGLVPPFLLFLLFSPTAHSTTYAVKISTLSLKLESLLAVTLFSAPRIELALLLLAISVLAIALGIGRVYLTQRSLFLLTPLIVFWLIAPRSALGSGYFDYRLPWAIGFFLLAGLAPRNGDYRMIGTLGGMTASLVLARVALIGWLWLSWEPVLAAIDSAFAQLPEGARVMVVSGPTATTSVRRSPSLLHVAAYSVARRQAFETGIYASVSGQILELRPAWVPYRVVEPPERLNSLDPIFTHVFVTDPATARLAPDLPLRRVAGGPRFALFQVEGAMKSSDSK
jgi:hypothetical protein